MFTVYILCGDSGRHYIGATSDMALRFAQHAAGHTHTTKRLGGNLRLVAQRTFPTRQEALAVERRLKGWKNPLKAAAFLHER